MAHCRINHELNQIMCVANEIVCCLIYIWSYASPSNTSNHFVLFCLILAYFKDTSVTTVYSFVETTKIKERTFYGRFHDRALNRWCWRGFGRLLVIYHSETRAVDTAVFNSRHEISYYLILVIVSLCLIVVWATPLVIHVFGADWYR